MEARLKRLINSIIFPKTLSPVERRAWTPFVSVVKVFLGNNKKAENYKKIFHELVNENWKIGCRMSLKLHLDHGHLLILMNSNITWVTDYSEKQAEIFH